MNLKVINSNGEPQIFNNSSFKFDIDVGTLEIQKENSTPAGRSLSFFKLYAKGAWLSVEAVESTSENSEGGTSPFGS